MTSFMSADIDPSRVLESTLVRKKRLTFHPVHDPADCKLGEMQLAIVRLNSVNSSQCNPCIWKPRASLQRGPRLTEKKQMAKKVICSSKSVRIFMETNISNANRQNPLPSKYTHGAIRS